jgi:phosphohistidine phosphatase
MARQLWFLRHGEAEPHGAREDSARRLTDRGVAQSRAAGEALRALGIAPAIVFSSPKVRAIDTARHACAALGVEPVEDAVLASGFDAQDALRLAEADEEGPVIVVGHEPDFSQVVHDLTGARVDLKKGGVAGVRLDGAGELIVLLRPRELFALIGAELP